METSHIDSGFVALSSGRNVKIITAGASTPAKKAMLPRPAKAD